MTISTQLLIWAEPERVMPNCVARSSLFNVDNVRSAGKRKVLEDVEIATGGGLTISYSGTELRQDDADVWLQLVHMSRANIDQPQPVEFTCNSMLVQLGWSRTPDNRKRLATTIERMQWTRVRVAKINGTAGYAGSLIDSFQWKKDAIELRTWTVRLNSEIAAFFIPTGYTRLDWETRKQLPPLGKWLQTYFLSHKIPYPVSFEWLRTYSGTKCASPKKWREQVLAAMPKLIEHGVVQSFSFEDHGRQIWVKR